MTDISGGCAVITGGGGLLGRAMARAFAREGMDVVIADIADEPMAAAVADVEALGRAAIAVRTDVSRAEDMDALAEAAWARFGRVNLLCLNAGRSILKPVLELTRADWDAVLGAQFHGVMNGIHSFLPRLAAQGGERHIVVTSSMSGVGRADMRSLNAPYVTAKFAVVGLTEVMAPPLAEQGIGMSVLCPGMTVADPEAMRGREWPMASAAFYAGNLLDGDQVAAEVVHGVREGRLHIFPHRVGRDEVLGRHALLMKGFDQAERTSPPMDEA
jgi:NAD(P)-dependent dehydrogenase (short-subunit alcohol dehydrogenase family)